MKLLLTIIMTTLVSASAFAACGPDTPKDCKDASSCERISKKGGVEFVFNGTCMVKDTVAATSCESVNDSNTGKGSPASGTSTSGSSGAAGTTR